MQAVGFRWFVRDTAASLSLDGWVRNLPDGRSVEAVAQGPHAQLDQLAEAMRIGPPGAHVAECRDASEPPEEIPEGFHIVR